MNAKTLLVGATISFALTAACATQATSIFSTATGAIAITKSPTVTTTTVSYSSAPLILYGQTVSWRPRRASGATGTLTFSSLPAVTVAESLTDFLTFNSSSTPFEFNVSSVTTLGDIISPASTTISLYLLGNVVGGGYAAGPTSVTLQINSTGASVYSSAATIAAPPSLGTPEPAAWAMMLAGFGISGALLRRSRTKVAAWYHLIAPEQ